MSTNLYETLGISRNATSEEVRKAYRRKALETHPDRLPRGASAAEKAASEELFRNVNNAYEVLSDPQRRATYDQHGVWPIPMPSPQAPFANGANAAHDPFSNPFFRDPFSRAPRMDPFGGFGAHPFRGFTDPFVLFNSIFGDLHRAFESDPFFDEEPFGRRGFGSGGPFGGNFFNRGFPSVMPSPFDFSGGVMGGSSIMQGFGSGSGNNSGNGRWVSESWTSSTVNGVTHTKCVRRDSEGNEHVTHRYPDGTERRTINGMEQPSSQPQRALPSSAPPAPPVPYPTRADSMPPPPPYTEAVAQPPHRSRSSRRYATYDDYPSDRRDYRDDHRHDYTPRDHRHGYDGQGHDTQSSSPRKFWRS